MKFCIKLTYWPRWIEIADFRSLFARSDSAVTPSEKVQLILIWSPLRVFQWAQDERRTLSLPLPPRGWLRNAVSKIWTISCDNSEDISNFRDRIVQKVPMLIVGVVALIHCSSCGLCLWLACSPPCVEGYFEALPCSAEFDRSCQSTYSFCICTISECGFSSATYLLFRINYHCFVCGYCFVCCL